MHTQGKTLVVFGGASGIGLATVQLGLERYEHVVMADVDEKAARGIACIETARAQFVRCDAGDPPGVVALLESVQREHGALSAVVTTVGGAHFHDPLVLDLEAWRREIGFNLDTAYVVATAAARLMVEQAAGGAIVTTSSSYAALPGEDRAGYTAGKAGVIAFTRSLAKAVARRHVRVNCVSPGSTDTARLRRLAGSDEAMAARHAGSPQGRISTTEDVAEAILFLASEGARSMTGQVLWVNNGVLMP